MKRNNQKRGFTIVELVIVIAVIAILAAVLIPTYANLVKKANEAAALSDAKNLVTEMLANILSGGDDAADLVIVTKKGDEAYIHGYDASESRVVAYANNPVQLESGDFVEKARATCDGLNGALTKINDVAEWRKSENLNGEGGTVATLGFKPDEMAVFADYEIEANFTEGAGTKVSSSDIASAVANGGKVVLSDDVTLNDTLTITKETIIDLNGKTLANTADKYTIQVEKGAKLTIKGGTVKNDNANSSLIDNKGTLVIEDGTFTGSVAAVVKNEPGATLTINGGTFTNNKAADSYYYNTILNYGTATINGGKYTAVGGAAVWNDDLTYGGVYYTATATINGGEFISTLENNDVGAAVYNRRSTMTVNGGKFTGYYFGLENYNGQNVGYGATLCINGGEFCYTYWDGYGIGNDGTVPAKKAEITGGEFHGFIRVYAGEFTITGGTYYKDPTSKGIFPEGYEVKDNGNGKWTVTKK